MLFTTIVFKRILAKEMAPNFVRKVPKLKNNLQVGRISVANKHREELLDFNVRRSKLMNYYLRRTRRPDGYFCQAGNRKRNYS